jgi:hypothetical protein
MQLQEQITKINSQVSNGIRMVQEEQLRKEAGGMSEKIEN